MPVVNGVGGPGVQKRRHGSKRRGWNRTDLTIEAFEVAQPAGKPAEHEGPRLYRQRATAPAPDPTAAAVAAEAMAGR